MAKEPADCIQLSPIAPNAGNLFAPFTYRLQHVMLESKILSRNLCHDEVAMTLLSSRTGLPKVFYTDTFHLVVDDCTALVILHNIAQQVD